jgi:glycosyltransferase involved in cell wall biosynthesis
MQYSFVVPIYNDAYLAKDFCEEFENVFKKFLSLSSIETQVELIFVSDGSTEEDLKNLKDLSQQFSFVKIIELSRNFGQHVAISCGYRFAKGEYVGMLNVDLEDHPDQIPIMMDCLKKENLDIVLGLYHKRNIPFIQKITSYLFYSLLNKMTGFYVPFNFSTIRIMSRRFVNTYNEFSEKSRYLPGLENWLGFKRGYAYIRHQKSRRKKSSYSFGRRIAIALESVIAFSDLPLRAAVFVGIAVSAVGFIVISIVIIQKIFFKAFLPGYVSTIAIITFLAGVQIIVMGIIGFYVGQILREVQNRPIYVIKGKHGF